MRKAKLDPDAIAKLAKKLWSDEQIAAFLGVHRTTLTRRFAQLLADCREQGRAILIDEMWRRAFQEKNDTIFIHMLNRYLGPIPQKIQLTREQAIDFLQKDAEQRGLITAGDSQSSEEKTGDS